MVYYFLMLRFKGVHIEVVEYSYRALEFCRRKNAVRGAAMMKMFDMNLDEEPSIDLTPLIDTIFMLLIFFIMTTTFSRPVLDILLPESEEAEVSGEHREQVISITPDVKQVKRSAPKPEVMPKSRSKPVLKSGKVSSAGKAIVVHKRAADVPGQPVICSGDAFSMPGVGGRRGGRG